MKVFSTKEVAEELGVHVNTVRAMVDDGRIKSFKTSENGHWRYNAEDVAKIKKQMVVEANGGEILKHIRTVFSGISGELATTKKNEMLWRFISRHFGIPELFGKYVSLAEQEFYYEFIRNKQAEWIHTSIKSINRTREFNAAPTQGDLKTCISRIVFATGFVKRFDSVKEVENFKLVPLIVVEDFSNKTWVVDGTLHWFKPSMKKGLVVFTSNQAVKFYSKIEKRTEEEIVSLFKNKEEISKLEKEYFDKLTKEIKVTK